MAIKLKNSATWLGIVGAVIGIYLVAQAFWLYYTERFGASWRLLLQLFIGGN